MFSRMSESSVLLFAGMVVLLTATLIGLAGFSPTAVMAGVTPTQESPVDTPTPVPPTDTPIPPTEPPVQPTRTPWSPQYPTPTPVPITEIFIPAPSTGGQPALGMPIVLWEAGLGLVLIGLGLAWRRNR